MPSCTTRLIALGVVGVLLAGSLAWSISTISSAVSGLFPGEAENQAIRIALQQQEQELEQQHANWERGQAEANALLPVVVLTKSALLLLGVIVVAGLLAIGADIYLRYRSKELARRTRYVWINGQVWLLNPPAQNGQRAILASGDPKPPVATATRREWRQPPPVDLDPVWTDHPAQYGPEDQARQHIRYYSVPSTHHPDESLEG